MTDIRLTHAVYTFGTALFAGLLYAFEQGVIPALRGLTASEYTRMEQALIHHLDAFPTGVIAVATVSMLLPLYPLIRLRGSRDRAFWKLTFAGWLLFCFGVGVFTIVLNVPVNEYVKTWSSASPPADWQAARDRWNTLNHIRTPLNLVSLACYIWASYALGEVTRQRAVAIQGAAPPAS
ncbi:MAG: DUF1772 domain-containing protein [Candidatus Latescibacterota bacterium]